MKKFSTVFAVVLFIPACVIGFLVQAAKSGFDTGKELADD